VNLDPTSVQVCQMASKSAERFKQGAQMWQTTDRQTDRQTDRPHYGEMWSYGRNRLR